MTLLLVGGIVTCFFLFAEEPPGIYITIASVVTLGILTYGLLVSYISYIYGDSKRRGMRPVLWTLIAAFVPNAIGFIVYFILRESILQPCQKVYEVDPLLCTLCGAEVKILSFITEFQTAKKILDCIGLPPQKPEPLAHSPPLFNDTVYVAL